MAPGEAIVEGLVEPGVGAGQEVVPVLGIDPEGMVVAMGFPSRPEIVEAGPTVPGHLHEDVHLVDQFGILG